MGAAPFGIEEDGNLPDSDSGETRFDSAGPDQHGMWRKGKRACFGSRRTRFESSLPDHGSLAQMVERPAENGQVGGSITPGATMRM